MNPKFVKLDALVGEKYILKSSIRTFGYSKRESTTANTSHNVTVLLQTSGGTSATLSYDIASYDQFKTFRDAMLEPGTGDANMKATKNTLKITGNAQDFYYYLNGMSEIIQPDDVSWRINKYDNKFLVERYMNGSKQCSVHLNFNLDSTFAIVTQIYTPEFTRTVDSTLLYNSQLSRFVAEVIRPYAATHTLKYKYSGSQTGC